MSRHIIHQQKVTIHVPKSADAHFFQGCVSDLLQNQLPKQVETMLDELFPPDKIVRINSLQLALGNLSAQNFEQDFKEEFIKALGNSLSLKKDAINAPGNEDVLSGAQSLVSSFIYFLEKGYLPWYSATEKMSEWEKEMLTDLSAKEYDHLFDWLKDNHRYDPVIIQRLVIQFSDAMLEKLLSEFAPSVDESWQFIYEDYNCLLKAGIRKRSSFRNEIWEYVFHALLINREKTWASKVLKSLIDHFGITVPGADIISGRDISRSLKTAIVQDAFKALAVSENQDNNVSTKKRPANNKEGLDNEGILSDNGKELVPGWSRDKKRKWEEDDNTLYVNNSGIVLLHYFLKPFFQDLNLWEGGKFINDKAHQRAVLLLHYLATGDTEVAEFNLFLQKILCGYPLKNTLPPQIRLSKKEKDESEKLLRSVIDYWPPLKGTSVTGLRSTFFQRDGKLVQNENGWQLTVEQKTVDILLGKLPWGFSTIRLPWMEQILNVDWY